jgi:hypothetical protein
MLGAVKGLSGLKGAIKSVGGLKGLVTGTITHGLAAIKSTFGALKSLGTRVKSVSHGMLKVLARPVARKPSIPKTSLDAYPGGKSKVSGVGVRPDGTEVFLVSGKHPPAWTLPSTPGMNGVTKTHVEAHAAAIMRLENLKGLTLWINKAPCNNGLTGCRRMLPRMVPEGSVMTVHVIPNGSTGKIMETIIVHGVG